MAYNAAELIMEDNAVLQLLSEYSYFETTKTDLCSRSTAGLYIQPST